MTFHNKIFFGYLLMALVFMGGILLCLKTLGPIERSFEKLSAENLPVLNLVQNIRTQGSMLHAEMFEMAALLSLEVTPESDQAILMEWSEIEGTQKQLRTDMQEYRKLVELYFPEESSYIPLLQTQIDQLFHMGEELRKRDNGPTTSLSLLMKSRFESLEESFLAVTNEIVSYEVREVQMRRERVIEAVANARFWIGLIFVVTLGVAMMLPRILFRLRSAADSAQDAGRRQSYMPRRNSQRE
jgi:hypothetical protein